MGSLLFIFCSKENNMLLSQEFRNFGEKMWVIIHLAENENIVNLMSWINDPSSSRQLFKQFTS